MAEWEKEIAELKTDVKYIREDIGIMQKQVRDLNKHTNMGLGGIKSFINCRCCRRRYLDYYENHGWY
jgi:hypothetical protein